MQDSKNENNKIIAIRIEFQIFCFIAPNNTQIMAIANSSTVAEKKQREKKNKRR